MAGSTAAAVVETAQSYFYTIAVGIVILLIGFGLGILVKKMLQKLLHEIELNKITAHMGLTCDLEAIGSSIISYLIYLITIVFFLNQLGITSMVLYIVVGAVLMLLILIFLVGLKDIIPNLIAGFMLHKKGKIKEGQQIEIKEIIGTVEKIGHLETEIKTEHEDLLYVPNSLFLKSKVKVKKEEKPETN